MPNGTVPADPAAAIIDAQNAFPDSPTTSVQSCPLAKTWFRVQLLDEDGQPMNGEDYAMVDSAGTSRKGKLDANGEFYIPEILPKGQCTIDFPNIHLNPLKRK